ncbi:MAG: S24/S26 family peptidase [Candidatus Magnetomorum sp.]|nr:S24/S26 family peptidase [Candidatus Magnetomorum sp.]
MKIIKNKSLPKAIIRIWQTTGKIICIKVDGHSMRPYFQKGDQVELLISNAHVFQYKIGDIIAFLQDDMIIIHRYIKKKKIGEKWVVCQRGDNLRGFRWIDADQIIGTATAIHRNARRIDLQWHSQILQNRFLGCLAWAWVFCLERFPYR